MEITFPVEPILRDPTLQALLGLTIPEKPALQSPVFEGIVPPSPDNTVMSNLPFVYVAYANAIQDDIDGKILDLSSYTLPDAQVTAKWRVEKEKVLRTFHDKRMSLLQAEGPKNHICMPGIVKRRLMELSLDEKRSLAETSFKLLGDNLDYSIEQVEYALKSAVDSDVVRFDSHHRLQSTKFEAPSFIVKAGFDAVGIDIDKYNETLSLIEAELQQDKNETLALMQLLQEFSSEIKGANLQVEEETILLDAYKAGVDYAVAKAGMDLVKYDVYLIHAEIARNLVEIDVAKAQLSLAIMQAITSQYEVYKAGAKVTIAELEKFKQKVNIKKAELDILNSGVQRARADVANATDLADSQMSANHEKLQIAREELSAAITNARAQLEAIDTAIQNFLTALETSTSTILIADYAAEGGIKRAGDLYIANRTESEEQTQTMRIADTRVANIKDEGIARRDGDLTAATLTESERRIKYLQEANVKVEALIRASEERRRAMIAAAEAAANAKVTSDYYHVSD